MTTTMSSTWMVIFSHTPKLITALRLLGKAVQCRRKWSRYPRYEDRLNRANTDKLKLQSPGPLLLDWPMARVRDRFHSSIPACGSNRWVGTASSPSPQPASAA